MKNRTNLIRLYLDTSVYGSYNNHKEGRSSTVCKLFTEINERKDIKIYYSLTILRELRGAPKKVQRLLEEFVINKKAKLLRPQSAIYSMAQAYVDKGALTKKSYEDALHIAYATYYNMNMLLTYNMKHMANFIQARKYNEINEKLGFNKLTISTPLILI